VSETQIGGAGQGEAVDAPSAVGLALLMSDAEAAIAAAEEEIAMLSRAVAGGLASLPKLLGIRPPEAFGDTVDVAEQPAEEPAAEIAEAISANVPVTPPTGVKLPAAAVPGQDVMPASLVPPPSIATPGRDAAPAGQAPLPATVLPGEAVMPAAVPVSSLVPPVVAGTPTWPVARPVAAAAPAPVTAAALPEPWTPPVAAAPAPERLPLSPVSPATPPPPPPPDAVPGDASAARTIATPAPIDYAAFAPAPVGPPSVASGTDATSSRPPAQAVDAGFGRPAGANAPPDPASPAGWPDADPGTQSFAAPAMPPAQTSLTSLAPLPRAEGAQSASQQGGPTHGDVFLDGARVGHWMSDTLARAVSGPSGGCTAFDPTMSAAWPGALQGR